MKRFKFIAIMSVLLTMSMWHQGAWALELDEGFIDIPWGENRAALNGLKLLSEGPEISYYVKPDRIFQINNIEVANVVYGFYADQFFAVYISVESIEVFGQLRKYIAQKYGDPHIKMETLPQQTVYTWKHEQVKIKMKQRDPEGEMKVGIYYMPLAGKANRVYAEEFEEAPKARFPLNERKQREAVEHFNLLNF